MTRGFLRLPTLLMVILLAQPAWSHGDVDISLFVATSGVDAGRCQSPRNPCRTIAYALRHAGKGGRIFVAGGEYTVADADEVFQIISGIVDIRGGFEADGNSFREAGLATSLIGIPHQYRSQVERLGFHHVADQKSLDPVSAKASRDMLSRHQKLQSGSSSAPCVGGMVDGLSCQNTELLAHVAFADVSGNPGAGADIWGFVDLNTDREYAIVNYNNGTAVFDVTDPANPTEVGFIQGQNTVWRDIKVHQYFNAADNRWNASAYVTSDGTNEGLFVIDLSGLPHSIQRVPYSGDFGAAHNVFAIDTDYGTGLSRTGASPSLVVAGSNNGGGRFRVYTLDSPDTPSFTAIANVSSVDYMHDAASIIIRDPRKDTQCINATDYCEVLFDFNESTIDVWDITDPSNAARLSRTTYANAQYTHSGWPSEDGQFLFVHDELDEQQSGLSTTVRTFSLANLSAPLPLVGTWSGPTTAIDHNGFVRGNRYYMSNYSRGLTILDISDPTSMRTVGRLDTYPFSDSPNFVGAWGAFPFFHSGNIAVSDMSSGFYMIGDNTLDSPNGQISFSQSAYAGTEGGSIAITLQRRNGSSGAISVTVDLVPATANLADFVTPPVTASWPDGDSADRTLVFNPAVDGQNEGLERLLAKLVAPTGGATLSPTTVASIYVSDVGDSAIVEFDQAELTTSERGYGKAIVTLQRRGSASGPASVQYSIGNSDAIDGVDFTGVGSGTVNWLNDDANPKSIEFDIVNDGIAEADEFFELTLSSPSAATLGSTATVRVNILDGSGTNQPPNANAGISQNVSGGSSVSLNGVNSNDPDNDPLSYEWTQLLGPAVTINNASSVTATITAPTVSADTLLQFQLRVTDINGASDTSTTNVTVRTNATNNGGGGGGAMDYVLLSALILLAQLRRRVTRRDVA